MTSNDKSMGLQEVHYSDTQYIVCNVYKRVWGNVSIEYIRYCNVEIIVDNNADVYSATIPSRADLIQKQYNRISYGDALATLNVIVSEEDSMSQEEITLPEVTIEVSLYVGQNYGQKHVLFGDKIPDQIFDIGINWLAERLTSLETLSGDKVGGATITNGVGYWNGKRENTTIITLWLTEKNVEFLWAKIKLAVGLTKLGLWQDSIGVTKKPITVDYL